MSFARTKPGKGWFATPLFQTVVFAVCMLLTALQSQAQNATPILDFANLVFEADELSQSEDGETILLRGNVIVDDGTRVLIADHLTLNRLENRATASGNVTMDLGEGQAVHANALLLDEPTTTLLLSGLSVRVRETAVLAAAKATTNGQVLTLDYMAYTACNAPCDIDLYRQRSPLPWRLSARKAMLDSRTDNLHLQGVRLELFGLPVVGLPTLSMPAPYVDRRSGFLRPVAGSETGLGTWIGQPLFLTLGRSADLTLTPVVYTEGLVRMDLEHRIHTSSLEAEITTTLDSQGRAGGLIDLSQQLSPDYDIELNLDWAGELERGTLQSLDQTQIDLHQNRLSVESLSGHSFAELSWQQDRILSDEPEWTDLNWDESGASRARYDWRLPPMDNGSRLRVTGQGLLHRKSALVESSAAWDVRAVTRGGLALTPNLEVGFVASDTTGQFSPWFGAQVGAALPLVRQDRWTSLTLTPTLAVSGLSGASVSDSPHEDQTLLSRSALFDLRSTGNPYGHASDLRADMALDVALYPHGSTDGSGLRASLGQRLSWKDTALAPAIAEVQAQTGALQLNLLAELDTWAIINGDARADSLQAALPRFALQASVPLSEDIRLSGGYKRVHTDEDQQEINTVRADMQLSSQWHGAVGLGTRQTGQSALTMNVEAELGWNFIGDWVAEAAIRQNAFDVRDQDLSFDLYHRCDCLGAQIGVLRERTATETSYSARFALDLPTLFSRDVTQRVFRHR